MTRNAPPRKRPWLWVVVGATAAVLGAALALSLGEKDTYPMPSLGSHSY